MRIFYTLSLATLAILGLSPAFSAESELTLVEQVDTQKNPFVLLPLPYPFGGLEPNIDTWTMELHWGKHHKAYVDNLNKAVKGTKWEGKTLTELFMKSKELPIAIRNNAGGHWNHTFFWEIMTDDPEKRLIPERLQTALCKQFGSMETLKEQMRTAALARFGSGWAWLVKLPTGELKVISSPNQDNPLMKDAELCGTPVLACDVWEHAYYLKYQNRRNDYFDGFWNVINWKQVDELVFGKSSTARTPIVVKPVTN